MISPLEGEMVKLISCTTALSRSGLYDIDYALNPYKGCAHGCLYCYALDIIKCEGCGEWGSWVEARTNISRVLKKEVQKIGDAMIGLATVTDPYQPAEARLGLTRACLEVISKSDASLMLMTKSPLARRDFDLLRKISKLEFCVTISTFDEDLARSMEPNAPSPRARLELLRDAADAGLRTTAMISPWLIATDHPESELMKMIELLGQAGCRNITLDRLRLRSTAVRRIRDVAQRKGTPSTDRLASVVDLSERIDVSRMLESISAEACFPKISFDIPKID
ncbi:MAG TPA: radical SAM protein [Thermoplasmata archaeon]|nr:radical SAM protein [Thermoplasmata archaeon]